MIETLIPLSLVVWNAMNETVVFQIDATDYQFVLETYHNNGKKYCLEVHLYDRKRMSRIKFLNAREQLMDAEDITNAVRELINNLLRDPEETNRDDAEMLDDCFETVLDEFDEVTR